jgi:hypothetical protein
MIPSKDLEAMKLVFKKPVAPIKDRCAFFAEMIEAVQKLIEAGPKEVRIEKEGGGVIVEKRGEPDVVPFPANAELKDIMIEGNTAKGVMVTKVGARQTQMPVEFHKVEGSWKIELQLVKMGDMGDTSPRPGKKKSDPPQFNP